MIAALQAKMGGVDQSTHETSTGFHLFEWHQNGATAALATCLCCTGCGLTAAMGLGAWRLRILNRRSREDRRARYTAVPTVDTPRAPPIQAPANQVPAVGAQASQPAIMAPTSFVSQPLQAASWLPPVPDPALLRESVRREMRAHLLDLEDRHQMRRARMPAMPRARARDLEDDIQVHMEDGLEP